MKNQIKVLFVLVCSLGFLSCGSIFKSWWECYVDSVGNEPASKSYYIEDRFPPDMNPLVVQEYNKNLEVVLNRLGYWKRDSAYADLKIAFGFNLGEIEERVYTYTEPIYRYIPESTSKSSKTTKVKDDVGNTIGTVNTTTTDKSGGGFDYVGESTGTSYESKQAIAITIDAFDTRTKQLTWSTTITDNTTPDLLADLRKYMPLYLLCAEEYIGKVTAGKQYSKTYLDDARLEYFPGYKTQFQQKEQKKKK